MRRAGTQGSVHLLCVVQRKPSKGLKTRGEAALGRSRDDLGDVVTRHVVDWGTTVGLGLFNQIHSSVRAPPTHTHTHYRLYLFFFFF